MDDLRPAESEPRRTLVVKLKLPVAHMPTPVQAQLLPEQTEIAETLQQQASDAVVTTVISAPPELAAVNSPQSSLISFPISNVRQEPFTSTANECSVIQTLYQDSSQSELPPSEQVASLPSAPQDDATTKAGAPMQDSATDVGPSVAGEATSDHYFIKEPESECIRVSKPRPAEEDVSQAELEKGPQPPRLRASISINHLLRANSKEAVAHPVRSQNIAPEVNVSPAGEAIYDTRAPQTPSNITDDPHVPTAPVAHVRPPHSDLIMQEPDGKAGITATVATPATTPQTGKVVLRLSPASMAKLAVATKSLPPSSYYGRDPNPRRNATKAFGVVQTPEAAVNPRKPPVKQRKTATDAPSRKRGAQGNVAPATAKRHKSSGASPNTRSSQDSSEAPASSPEYTAGPASELDAWTGEPRPIRDVEGDGVYVKRMLSVLAIQSASTTNDTAKEQSVTMKALLERATHAGEEDALFLTPSEAMQHLAPGKFWNNVMITAEQQHLPLQTIDQFLREYYEEDILVWIQDCSAKSSKRAPSIRQVSIKAVRQRFAAGQPLHPKPWNLLELAAHHEDGLRPRFLNNEDCRLLTKLKIPTAADHTRRKTYPAGFKEVEKWALLAQAGALTMPHQDSHGYSTYITVNVGLVGFGWLSFPTSEKRAEWNKTAQRFINGSWRYVILKPGQTIYFPAGTVHFVFRLPSAGNTLAFGGHVLRCSNIVHWVRCLLEEVQSASVTNEDLTDSSTGYLERVERFVLEAKKNGSVERWGGEESIEKFLKLKAKFTALKKQSMK